jgi:hypothetical protein
MGIKIADLIKKVNPALRGNIPAALLTLLCIDCFFGAAASAASVTTYHGDSQRTGWNQQETVLTPAAVGSAAFKQLGNVALDAQIDAQPLYVAGQTITGQGTHNVVYVATENNTVYAIDADTGAILLQRNFGTPIQINQLPGACDNNSNIVGITATPVIDATAQTLYVLVYSFENNAAIYRMRALDLRTLADKVTPVVVTGTGTLNPSNAKYNFNANYARSRAALLLSKGNVYAAFTSFCDFNANVARGWVLGWNASTLQPLPQPALLNRQSSTPNNYFLSTVWMSGYGPAVDNAGSLFVVTGNSDPSGMSYNPPYGIAESVVKLSSDLTTIQSLFTPAGGSGSDYATLERTDGDFAAGGVMVIPTQPGPTHPNMAVAAGKFGAMYLMDSNDLGGYREGSAQYPDRVLNAYTIGSCYCGQSYFKGADGIGRVVSSGGNTAMVWKINNGVNPSLTRESISAPLVNGANNGFFTTISSNGTVAKSQVIWAIGRPISSTPGTINLYAFDPSTVDATGKMATLFSGAAGTWPMRGRANLVPTVVNGRVFVASYKQLAIFGTGGSSNSDVVSFTASGTLAGGVGPLVTVVADGRILGTTSVGTAVTTYSFSTSLAPNTAHNIQIQYTNDDVINGQDRNLILRSIGVNGQTVLATSQYEVYHSGAFGGPGDLASNGNMYWSGTAEFKLPASLFPAMAPAAKTAKTAAVAKASAAPLVQAEADPVLPGHSIYGVLVAMKKGELTLRTRTGALVKVNNTAAVKSFHSVIPIVGGALLVRGEYDKSGVLQARSIQSVQNLKALWGKDS